jgi:hypothetical protein
LIGHNKVDFNLRMVDRFQSPKHCFKNIQKLWKMSKKSSAVLMVLTLPVYFKFKVFKVVRIIMFFLSQQSPHPIQDRVLQWAVP